MCQDLRYSARILFKNKGFTAAAILTLALGIGANTAIFSLVRAALLRPLPFPAAERLIGIRESKTGEGRGNPLAWRSFFTFRDQTRSFESVAAWINWNADIEREDGGVRVAGARVSDTYFKVLGVLPLAGRDFTPEDDRVGAQPVAILGYETWQRIYGGTEDIIGRTLRIDGRSYDIIGVMPRIGQGSGEVGGQLGWRGIWTPLRADEARMQDNPGRALRVNARLKTGAGLEGARAELDALMAGLKQEYPATHGPDIGVYAAPLRDYVIDPNTQRAMWLLLGVVVCILLIACANVANLLLVRTAERGREIAVRAALGASRFAIIRQLLTESMLLSTIGGAAGWLLAHWMTAAAGSFLPEAWQRMGESSLDAGVFAFTLVLSALTGLMFGLAPALGAARININEALKDGIRAGGGSRQKLRGALLATEVALALMLLAGAGLLVKSFVNLRRVELGFNPDKVLTMNLRLPNSRYPEPSQRVNFFEQTLSNIKRLPGVESTAICFSLLMTGEGATDPVVIEGRPAVPKGEEPVLRGGSVSADYFRTMGIAFRRGRAFTDEETWQQSNAIIVNEAFADRFFPGEDPIGKRIKAGVGDPPWSTIVGVVANHIQPGVDNRVWEEMFYPYVNTADPPLWGMNLVVRTSGDPVGITQSVVDEARRLDRMLPIARITTLDALTQEALRADIFNVRLMGAFAILALALAVIGIYGVTSYSVAQRTREIGIRAALGAQRGDIMRMVIGQSIKTVFAGLAAGLAAAWGLARWLEGLLFGVGAHDPETFAGITLLIVAVALAACWLPAYRASCIDPLRALRRE